MRRARTPKTERDALAGRLGGSGSTRSWWEKSSAGRKERRGKRDGWDTGGEG